MIFKVELFLYHFWNSNLFSNIQIEESIHGMHLKHEFSYTYDKKISIGIPQSFYPIEYGFRMGYKKRAFEFIVLAKLPWANSIGFALIYHLNIALVTSINLFNYAHTNSPGLYKTNQLHQYII